jgi:putative transposase
MRKMGIEAVYRKPNTSLPNKEHTIYPYLLKGLKVMRPNQVWATDITYIPMAKWFMYLIAIVDLFSRKVLTWSVSNTMEAEWCAEVLKQAINEFGKPEIFNTDRTGGPAGLAVYIQYLYSSPQRQSSTDFDGR